VKSADRILKVLPVALCLLTAGPEKNAVSLESGSSANNLAIHVADKRGGSKAVNVGLFRIVSCRVRQDAPADSAMWAINNIGSGKPMLITYGQAPLGFRTVTKPKPLVSGCYRAEISGRDRLRFEIRSDGSVIER
jgi:hypothetical protein